MFLRASIFTADQTCMNCLRRLAATAPIARRNASSATSRSRKVAEGYFSPNSTLREQYGKARWKTAIRKQSTTADLVSSQHSTNLPNRRRKKVAKVDSADTSKETEMPPDAPSRLTTLSASLPKSSLRRIMATYLSLSKPRLTFLIVLTTTAAYSMYPVPAMLSPAATSAPSLSTITLLFLTTGTFLTCASANTFNMLLEPEHDAKMSRTRNRPLVRKLISPRAALVFAIATGALGTFGLYAGVNPTTAALAAFNIFLYAGMYTPLKRVHPINTWVGALVGAIPPLMGWTAAAGQCATGSGDWKELLFGQDSQGGWALALLLFAWQIPHFAALSWPIRHEYAAAGYKMLTSTRPKLDAIFSLGCACLLPVSYTELYRVGVIEPWSFIAMQPATMWIVYRAWEFARLEGAKGSARSLFWASVWYLPIVLVLGMVGKKGLSDRMWSWFTGEALPEEDDGDWEWDDAVEHVAGETKP